MHFARKSQKGGICAAPACMPQTELSSSALAVCNQHQEQPCAHSTFYPTCVCDFSTYLPHLLHAHTNSSPASRGAGSCTNRNLGGFLLRPRQFRRPSAACGRILPEPALSCRHHDVMQATSGCWLTVVGVCIRWWDVNPHDGQLASPT